MVGKRKTVIVAALLCMMGIMGCTAKGSSPERIKDLEYTVLAEENIPEELKNVIDEKKSNEFKVTFQDNGFLYICTGYGEQISGGYSIITNDLYLTDNAVYVDTTLQGPDPAAADAPKKSSPSYPYIVIKTELVDKPVVFD